MNPNRPSVYRLDIHNGAYTRIRKHRSQIRQWYADSVGVVRIGVGFTRGDLPMVFRMEGRIARPYANPAFQSEVPPVPPGFSMDGTEVYMNMAYGTDRHGIYRVRYADGEVLDVVHKDPDFDVFGSLVSNHRVGSRLAYVTCATIHMPFGSMKS